MMASHRSIKARIVDSLEEMDYIPGCRNMHGWECQVHGPRRVTVLSKIP